MTDAAMATRFAGSDFRVGRVISRSLSLLLKRWLIFSMVSAVAFLPSRFVASAYQLFAPGGSIPLMIVKSGSALVFLALFLLTQAVIVHSAFHAMRGQRVDLAESAKIALRRFFPLLGIMIGWLLTVSGVSFIIVGASAVMGVEPGGPLLAFVSEVAFFVAMGFLVTMWFVSLQACVVEGTGVFGSLRRSAQLTKNNRWRIFGLFLMVLIVGLAVFIVLAALSRAGAPFVATTIAFVWQAFWGAYYAITGVVTYHDLRVAKEGMDVGQIAAVFD